MPESADRKLNILWRRVYFLYVDGRLSRSAYVAYKHVLRQLASLYGFEIADRELLNGD